MRAMKGKGSYVSARGTKALENILSRLQP